MSRLRVLVLVQGPLGDRLAGPEIRGWELARAFAARHDVTVAAHVAAPSVREGIAVVPSTRRSILAQARTHDVVAGPTLPPYLLAGGPRCLRVADLYDPVELELATIGGREARRAAAQQLAGRRMHLRFSDVVLCANERQRERTAADLARERPGAAPPLLTVPMGLPAPPPPAGRGALRALFDPIGADDPVVLWWGSVWRWLDAHTAVEAIGRLSERRRDLRLVITAGRPANTATDRLNVAEEVRELARDKGLLGRHVFFLDDWVPFEDRHRYIADADVGVTLHAATPEAELAARARYMDYVWASLPSVLAEGDEVAAELGAEGAAWLVPPKDPAAVVAALDAALADPRGRAAAARACARVAERYRWPALLAPVVDCVEALEPPRRTLSATADVAGHAGRYYARRAVDLATVRR